MDAFEQLVATALWAEGYWVQTSVKVALSKSDKVTIGRHSCPDWELDVVGYSGRDNRLIVVECKSYLDSTGVNDDELLPSAVPTNSRYKLFREAGLRTVILNRLSDQCIARGLCRVTPQVELGMAVGKFKNGHAAKVANRFAAEGWHLFGPDWVRERLRALSERSYSNDMASIVAKLLLR